MRRQLKNDLGLHYNYLKMNSLEIALRLIQSGKPVIAAQQASGFESSSGFRDACYRFFGTAPTQMLKAKLLKFVMLDLTHA